MPTGYTAAIADGSMNDFREYAMQCARAFGATIMLRDEPLSSEIPKFEPSPHYLESIKRLEADLERIQNATMQELAEMARCEFESEQARKRQELKRIEETRYRYEAMLGKAKAYKPPSPDHEGFANFLVSQIEESIKWDCSTTYWDAKACELKDSMTWKKDAVAATQKALAHARKNYEEEVERTRERNQWVNDLKESLK